MTTIHKHLFKSCIHALGLSLLFLSACQPQENSSLSVVSCIGGMPNDAYPQSNNIDCLHRFNTGSLEFQASESTRAVQFSNSGDTLYTLSTYIQQWDVSTGEAILFSDAAVKHTPLDNDEFLHFSRERGYVGFSDAGRVYTDIVANDPLLESRGSGYKKVAYIDGLDMFAGYDTESLYFYDRSSGQLVSDQPIQQGIERVLGGQTSYATALSDSRIVIWPLAEDGQGLVLNGHTGKVIELAYSDDESRFASVDSTGTVIVWDLGTGAEMQRLQIEVSPAVPAATVAFSPDNQMLAANGKGGGIALWSLLSGDIIAEFNIAKFGILDIDISPDGTKLAAGLSFAGKYDQNARVIVEERGQFDPTLLEAGPAVVFDISKVQPSQ